MSLNKSEVKNAVALYLSGLSVFETALELGVSPNTVWKALKKQGVLRKPKRWDCQEYRYLFPVFRLVLKLRGEQTLTLKQARKILKRHIESPSTISKYARLLAASPVVEIESHFLSIIENRDCPELSRYYKRFIKPVLEQLK